MKNQILFLLLSLFLATSAFSFERPLPLEELHAFHISKCQIDYNDKEQAIQITLHLFIDDLEEALKKQGADKLFIGTEKESKNAEKFILNYIQKCFKLKVNEKTQDYVFIGKEPSEDFQALWCYMEITGIDKVKSIFVENTLITEIYEDQKNIIHIMMPDKKQGYFILEKGKSSDKVNF